MKRILTLLAAVTMLVAGLSAQTRALATLSHNGQLTFFDKVSAFEDAVEAAVDGDTIYLSEGKFGVTSRSWSIVNKRISIIGSGYKSHIIAQLFVEAYDYPTPPLYGGISIDGVRIDKLRLDESGLSNNIEHKVDIKKSYIDNIDIRAKCTVLLDRCLIEESYLDVESLQINNSKIIKFKGGYRYAGSVATVYNCNMKEITSVGKVRVINSIADTISNIHDVVFENCLIGNNINVGEFKDRRNEFINCWVAINDVLDDNMECTLDDLNLLFMYGTDGTVIGIYGGQKLPYSKTPSSPSVDYDLSSVVYDKDRNKLSVFITIVPN